MKFNRRWVLILLISSLSTTIPLFSCGTSFKPIYTVPFPSTAIGFPTLLPTNRFDNVKLPAIQATGWFEGEINLTDASLDAVKQRVGRLWVPTYLPKGATLMKATATGNWEYSLQYKNLNIHVYSGGADMQFPLGTAEKVTVGTNTGYFIRGQWERNGDAYVWNADWPSYLMFSLDGWWFRFEGSLRFESSSLSSEELIKIAESLRPY
jgi:hypothetical protein